MTWLQLAILLAFFGTWFVILFAEIHKISEFAEQTKVYRVQIVDIAKQLTNCMALILGEKVAEKEKEGKK